MGRNPLPGDSRPVYEYGRFQLCLDTEAYTAGLFLENVNRAGEHWLTLALRNEPHCPIGYLRLRPISPNSHIFEVAEVRPANGPLLRLPDGSSGEAASEARDRVLKEGAA